ncbi:ETEC_3214 domain-containing protein [Ferrimonas balearica]|uniref:ETEC_3214 domain-containing protein n=1 Tax=Ferrimonas balearica TaxID=44012 RepID=UPI001C9A0B5C|nr:ETEC_3214 domain-containing protein [Ferrimonas balearica]MBY5992889.1 hypothetical protein [Ferrimonas balearica]
MSQTDDTPGPVTGNASKAPPRWRKLRSGLLYAVGLMIAFGNWNDTKELSTSLYETAIAHFTHQVELDQLDQLDVGNYLEYAENLFGIPQVVKASRLTPELQYRYYKQDKFLLILQVEQERIAGYLLQSLPLANRFSAAGPFTPPIPFTAMELDEAPLASLPFRDEGFSLDHHNLVYFLERHPLAADGLHLNLYLGITEYGEPIPGLSQALGTLDQTLVFEQGDDRHQALEAVRQRYAPNLYGLSELDNSHMAEALLTRYEFNAYF